MSDSLAILLAASLFGQQAFDGFTEEVGAVLAFVAFCFNEQCSFCSIIIDEHGFSGVMVVVLQGGMSALWAYNRARRNVFNTRSFGLPEAVGA